MLNVLYCITLLILSEHVFIIFSRVKIIIKKIFGGKKEKYSLLLLITNDFYYQYIKLLLKSLFKIKISTVIKKQLGKIFSSSCFFGLHLIHF